MDVVLREELLIFVLYEVFWVRLPGAEVNLGEESVGNELEDLSSAILPGLFCFVLTCGVRHIEDLLVELCGHRDLRLEVLELNGGDQDARHI